MKNLILILFVCASFKLEAQCKKIVMSAMNVEALGNCVYQFDIHVKSLGGNPSVEPRYRCGREGSVVSLNCINLGEDSVFTTEAFSCPCDQSVYYWLIGYASSNCHGDTCIAFSSQNLALKDKEKEEEAAIKKNIVYADHRFTINEERITQVEVYNLAGQIIFREKVTDNKPIELPYLITGVYFARFTVRHRDPITIKIYY